MSPNLRNSAALALLPAIVLAFSSCCSPPAAPPNVGAARMDYTKGVPGGVIVQTFKTTATVTAIDHAKRTATLQGSDGVKFAVNVGPAAVNFDQVRVGDWVNATVTQKIVATLASGDSAAPDRAGGVVASAPEGDQPGGEVAATRQVTAKVIAIDAAQRTATLRFENGQTEILPIRDDVDLSRRKVGEQVVFRITEMVAIRIEKP